MAIYAWAALAGILLAAAPPLAGGPADVTVLRQVKETSGGAAWDGAELIVADGTKESFGLTGRYQSAEDVRTGWFKRSADYQLLANAEGLDGAGRWRMDNSRQLHPLDSDEAKAVAISESYLARRGYLFPDRVAASFTMEEPMREGGRSYDRIGVVPEGGLPLILWIGPDHRLARAVIQLSTNVETIDYRDYRMVNGHALPFEIDTANGDQPETGVAHISAYRLAGGPAAEAVARPRFRTDDAVIRSGAAIAYAALAIDPTSGFPIVQASIDGKGPFPFILDTGGHDILTPAAAAMLGLRSVGSGFSQGAGSGSTPTRFTKVGRLSIGAAELVDSPFVVLDIDLGHVVGTGGKPVPIAGLIGLEVFERFVVTLDVGSGRVALRPFGTGQGDPSVPIRFTRDVPLVQAALAGHMGWFAVDTGNNLDLIVAPGWAKANGLTARSGKGGSSGSSVGGTVDLRRLPDVNFDIGPSHLRQVKALLAGENTGSLSSRSEAGNFGESILRGFTVTFDYRRETMTLRPAGR
jgi:hypothetical protein